jgi:hypothetical protein
MSYADVSLAASSTTSVSTPISAGTTFNFASPNARGDMNDLESNPVLPSTATSTKATNGNAVSDTQVPINTGARGVPTATALGSSTPVMLAAIAALALIGFLVINKQYKLI